jgi:hypothetical protein
MERIAAAENITIELSDARWRMIANGSADPQVLLEAESGQPVNYVTDFAATRRMPRSGSLQTDQIQRVVLGWSPGDESWHLGLLLEMELAQARGSRWCEIAHWPDPSTTVFHDLAARAGESLAQVTTRPFHFVEPKAEPAKIEAPPRPLPELPLEVSDSWRLEALTAGDLQLVRAPRVARQMLRRAIWYTLWSVVYFVLVYLTFTSGIAPSNPAFLPYLGIFSGVVLVFLVFKNIYQFLTSPDRIVIDAEARQVRGQRGSNVRWMERGSNMQGLYVSQQIGRRRGKKPAPQYGELNLYLANGKFHHLISADQIEEYEQDPAAGEELPQDSVSELTSQHATTNLQAAALHIGKALDLPVWYDQRST